MIMGAINKKYSMNNLEVGEGRRAWEEVRLFYRVDTCDYWCKRQSTREEPPCYRLKRTRVTMR